MFARDRNSVRARQTVKDVGLTDVEIETLSDIVVGLTDRAIARRRHISVRGVQNRLSMLLQKLLRGEEAHLRETADMEIFNARTRIFFECLRRGLLDTSQLFSLDGKLTEWLEDEFNFERTNQASAHSERAFDVLGAHLTDSL